MGGLTLLAWDPEFFSVPMFKFKLEAGRRGLVWFTYKGRTLAVAQEVRDAKKA